MASSPAPLPSLGLLDGLGTAPIPSSPAPLPSLGLLGGLGVSTVPGADPPLVWFEGIPGAWNADPGFAAAYALQPVGIPVGNRDEYAGIGSGTLALGGTVGVSGDPRADLLFDLSGSTVEVSGTVGIAGEIESTTSPVLDIVASALALSGSVAVAGDLEIAAGSGTGATAAEIVAALMAHEIEAGVSVGMALRIILAAVSGRSTGVGTSTEQYLNVAGTVARITTAFDGNGNRAAVTLDDS